MEKNYKRVPFTIELAKKIQSGEVEGHLVTQYGNYARLLASDISSTDGKNRLAVAVAGVPPVYSIGEEYLIICFQDGQCISGDHSQDLSIDLLIELPEETHEDFDMEEVPTGDGSTVFHRHVPKHEFKPFDKVLVRDSIKGFWLPKFFSETLPEEEYLDCGYRHKIKSYRVLLLFLVKIII